MSDTMRWRYGETSPVMLAIDSATVVEIGDLIYLDSGKAKPAGLLADQSSEAADQVAFHAKFTGVAMQRSRAGETSPIRIATSGVFEFPCASATFEVGDLVGPTVTGAGTALENQKAKAVPAVNRAVGRCARRVPSADTRVLVDIVSSISAGGVQAIVT